MQEAQEKALPVVSTPRYSLSLRVPMWLWQMDTCSAGYSWVYHASTGAEPGWLRIMVLVMRDGMVTVMVSMWQHLQVTVVLADTVVLHAVWAGSSAGVSCTRALVGESLVLCGILWYP